jgi:hypothetical protein
VAQVVLSMQEEAHAAVVPEQRYGAQVGLPSLVAAAVWQIPSEPAMLQRSHGPDEQVELQQ